MGERPIIKPWGKSTTCACSHLTRESCHALVVFFPGRKRIDIVFNNCRKKYWEKKNCLEVCGLHRGCTDCSGKERKNMARIMISTSSAFVYLYWKSSFINEMKIYHELIEQNGYIVIVEMARHGMTYNYAFHAACSVLLLYGMLRCNELKYSITKGIIITSRY